MLRMLYAEEVATALTVYGIETLLLMQHKLECALVATALTVYGIETNNEKIIIRDAMDDGCNSSYRLRY